MPPSQRSTSSRSAHKESSEIAVDQNYALGEYSFRIERSSVPGSSNDKIEAICTQGEKNARKSIQVPSSTQMLGWYVEANSDTADVYIIVKKPGASLPTNWEQPITVYPAQTVHRATELISGRVYNREVIFDAPCLYWISDSDNKAMFCAMRSSAGYITWKYRGWFDGSQPGNYANDRKRASSGVIIDGKRVYYFSGTNTAHEALSASPSSGVQPYPDDNTTWVALYEDGGGSGTNETILIGRFAIDLVEAGGSGTASNWSDPGDYDYNDYPDPDERDPEDPTYTLNLEVVGALSGRHNDPLNDTSYSYVPADKATVKDYGCGGDGGNGGGGGGGASTVVSQKFATSRADSKEIAVIVKRHGYGSGGGKGGKGGDGCILIYY